MILFKQIELLQRIHKLIDSSRTGTPLEFSQRIRISERHLREIIDEMKDLGAPIGYSRRNETYYYSDPFEIDIVCNFRRLSEKKLTKISVGFAFFKKIHLRFFLYREQN